MAMLILPFVGVASVSALFKSGLNKADDGEKDVYYGVKNNASIFWRFLLFSIAKRFKFLVSRDIEELQEIENETKRIKAIIFDDSTIEKTGKTIEGVDYVHDHTKNLHILGYKLLVCSFWDGVSFIPLDFSLHKEKRDRELIKAEERLTKKKEKIKKVETELRELKEKKILKIRWTIEVFFKECKQYLLLDKSQSQDFDAQIADITLSMIRYILLSYYERTHYGTTIGGLFRNCRKGQLKKICLLI